MLRIFKNTCIARILNHDPGHVPQTLQNVIQSSAPPCASCISASAPVVDDAPTPPPPTTETPAPESAENPGDTISAETAETSAPESAENSSDTISAETAATEGGDDGLSGGTISAIVAAIVLAMGGGLVFAFKNNNIHCCQRLQVDNSIR